MKKTQLLVIVSILIAAFTTSVNAAESEAPTQILINNVHVWDGTSDGVARQTSVLIEGNPLNDVAELVDYNSNIKVVIKDGKIFKNSL